MSNEEASADVIDSRRPSVPTQWVTVDHALDKRGRCEVIFFPPDGWLDLLYASGVHPATVLFTSASKLPLCTRFGSMSDDLRIIVDRDQLKNTTTRLPDPDEIARIAKAMMLTFWELSDRVEWCFTVVQ